MALSTVFCWHSVHYEFAEVNGMHAWKIASTCGTAWLSLLHILDNFEGS